MRPRAIRELLDRVSNGDLSPAKALEQLRHLPFEDLGFARVDHHRELRQGAPEVIYGEGKTPEQVTQIAQKMIEHGANVLVTRTDAETYRAVQAIAPEAVLHAEARCITVIHDPPEARGTVGVICAGTSDLPVAEEAAVGAGFFGSEVVRLFDVGVAGLHRLLGSGDVLDRLDLAIVVAGMEGALPSVVGGLVAIPIIAVPTSIGYGASFGGLAALLGMLNSCAAGVTVVNIDSGFAAAAAAHRILETKTRHQT